MVAEGREEGGGRRERGDRSRRVFQPSACQGGGGGGVRDSSDKS